MDNGNTEVDIKNENNISDAMDVTDSNTQTSDSGEINLEIDNVESMRECINTEPVNCSEESLEIRNVVSVDISHIKMEVVDEDTAKGLELDGSERDLSQVEPNRGDEEICTLQNIVIQNDEDKESVVKLSRDLDRLRLVVLDLLNLYPHYQPRSKEMIYLNTASRSSKELDQTEVNLLRTDLEERRYNKQLTNCGIENMFEILETVSPKKLNLKEKIREVIRNVKDLSSELVDYADHLRRKIERLKNEKEDGNDKEDETIGVNNVFITRRKNQFPIVGIAKRDMSPIRESFDIKAVIKKVDKDVESKSKSRDRRLTSPSPNRERSNSRSLRPFVKNLICSIDRLRNNMIYGLKADTNFKLKSDWEFFTGMFKKEAMNWNIEEKLEHLEKLVIEDHVVQKFGDPIWKFLETRHLTDDRINRIDNYSKNIESKFGIHNNIKPVFSNEETFATKKMKKGLFFVLKNNRNFIVTHDTVRMLDIVSSFDFLNGKSKGGILKDDLAQDTLDFLENDDLLPNPRGEPELLKKLDDSFLEITRDLWSLPEKDKLLFGQEISLNLEFESLRAEFLELAKTLKRSVKIMFEFDEKYTATGDEKYYLNIPGKENEKVFASDVKRYLNDFKADELSKTLKSKYDKFTTEQSCDGIKSFNYRLKVVVKNVVDKSSKAFEKMKSDDGSKFKATNKDSKGDVKNEVKGATIRSRSRSDRRRRSKSPPPRSRRSRSPPRRLTGRQNKFQRSPERRRESRGPFMSPAKSLSGPQIQPFVSNMNTNTNVIEAASQLLGQMNPLAVLNMLGVNPSNSGITNNISSVINSQSLLGNRENTQSQASNSQNLMRNQQNLGGVQQSFSSSQQNLNRNNQNFDLNSMVHSQNHNRIENIINESNQNGKSGHQNIIESSQNVNNSILNIGNQRNILVGHQNVNNQRNMGNAMNSSDAIWSQQKNMGGEQNRGNQRRSGGSESYVNQHQVDMRDVDDRISRGSSNSYKRDGVEDQSFKGFKKDQKTHQRPYLLSGNSKKILVRDLQPKDSLGDRMYQNQKMTGDLSVHQSRQSEISPRSSQQQDMVGRSGASDMGLGGGRGDWSTAKMNANQSHGLEMMRGVLSLGKVNQRESNNPSSTMGRPPSFNPEQDIHRRLGENFQCRSRVFEEKTSAQSRGFGDDSQSKSEHDQLKSGKFGVNLRGNFGNSLQSQSEKLIANSKAQGGRFGDNFQSQIGAFGDSFLSQREKLSETAQSGRFGDSSQSQSGRFGDSSQSQSGSFDNSSHNGKFGDSPKYKSGRFGDGSQAENERFSDRPQTISGRFGDNSQFQSGSFGDNSQSPNRKFGVNSQVQRGKFGDNSRSQSGRFDDKY